MALSAAQITQVFEIFGVPENGSGEVVAGLTTLFGPAGESYDLSAITALLNAKLSALSASLETRVVALLDRWDVVTSTSPLRLETVPEGRGTVVDHPAEREAIRNTLADLIGFVVPSGGFAAEARRRLSGGGTLTR